MITEGEGSDNTLPTRSIQFYRCVKSENQRKGSEEE